METSTLTPATNAAVISLKDASGMVKSVIQRAQNGMLTEGEVRTAHSGAQRIILGLPVSTVTEQQRAEQDKISSILRNCGLYVDAATGLKDDLLAASVEPIVILPATLWDTITKDSGLYTFHPKDDGSVFVSNAINEIPVEAVRLADNASEIMKGEAAGAGLFLLITSSLVFVSKQFELYSLFLSWQFFVSVVASAIVAFNSLGFVFSLIERVFCGHERYIRKIVKDKGGIHMVLWPDHDDDFYIAHGITAIKVTFPEPPQDVQEVIAKANTSKCRAGMRITVDKSGIGFQQDPFALMAAKANKVVLEEKEIRAQMNQADPIICVYSECGRAVAIIAQYGEFPVEIAAVQKAVSEYSFSD